MNARPGEIVIVGAGLAYLATLSWTMGNLSYDIWGALVVAPIYAVMGVALIRRMFRGSLRPVVTALTWGLAIKLGGAAARYWVGFEAYGGGIDAERYHKYAIDAAGKVWSGDASFTTVLPSGIGTEFLQRFTAFTYTITGGSQLAGFVTFSFLAYVGLLFVVKAAIIAVPSMATRRYAWMCVLFPSIVYWPSSIGKEALMMLGLGIATYGIAVMLTSGRWLASFVTIGVGLGFAALIRPHIAGIWLAAVIPGFVVALLFRSRTSKGPARANRAGLVVALAVAVAAFGFVASATVKFLAPESNSATDTVTVTNIDSSSTSDTDATNTTSNSLTEIFEETTRRTGQAGSNFAPPSVSNPLNWPYAVIRTLTRPLPLEAHGIAQLISAAEMAALFGIYLLSLPRLRNLPHMFISNPYVTFVVTVLFLAGLAYSSLANLGILTRQKSLVIPFLLLLPCLPERMWRKPAEEGVSGASRESNGSSSIRMKAGDVAVEAANRKQEIDIWT